MPRQVPLLQDDRAILVLREHPNTLADLLDDRSADEDTADGMRTPSTSRSASNESTWRP